MLKKTIKRTLNRFGYDLRKRTSKPYYDSSKDITEYAQIFRYFQNWDCKFELDSNEYGGKIDYKSVRISILNIKELYELIDFKGKKILELGPLEGGNTIILHSKDPEKIVSVEARSENYVKCCVIKNLYNLSKAKFYLGDARELSIQKYGKFDISVVLGVLYHLDKPHETLKLIAEVSDELVLATHYADEESPSRDSKIISYESNGRTYRGKIYQENPEFNPHDGLEDISFWPFEEDLLNMIRDAGFKSINILKKNPNANEQYKLIYLVAKKK